MGRDDESGCKFRFESGFIETGLILHGVIPRDNASCITCLELTMEKESYLALSGEHVFVLTIFSVGATVEPRHGIVEDPGEPNGEETLAIAMTDILSKVQGCSLRLVIVRNGFGFDSAFRLCLRSLDDGFLDFKLVRVDDNLIVKRI